jgi:hypothetical protein
MFTLFVGSGEIGEKYTGKDCEQFQKMLVDIQKDDISYVPDLTQHNTFNIFTV